MAEQQQSDILELIDRLDGDIAEIKRRSAEEGVERATDVRDLEVKRDEIIKALFAQLTPWQQVRLARHPRRPYTLDYLNNAFDDFLEMHGDRRFADDPAIVGGLAWIGGYPVVAIGHQKGRDIKERKLRNFGSARPEGYRKALRLMQLAEKLKRPVVCIVDTPAADCSVEAEERGISEAIATNLVEAFRIKTPILAVVIGEGGSGGALGIGVADKVMMMEHAIYSVIPPEGCAAILWRDPERKAEAAEALQLTSDGAFGFGLVDQVIEEPFGGAHRDPDAAARQLRMGIVESLRQLCECDLQKLLEDRYLKFRNMGRFSSPEETTAGKNGHSAKTVAKKKQPVREDA